MTPQPIEIPGRFGFGTMSMTWTSQPPPIQQSIDTLKYVTSHQEYGVKLLNGGEFYGPNDANLKLLQQFLSTNDATINESLIISIKGGIDMTILKPNGSKEYISKSIENVASYFPKKGNARGPKLIFEAARVDPQVPYEDTISYIKQYVDNGTIDGISLSEVGIKSIEKATSIAPISCVELELSLFSQDLIDNGILSFLSNKQIPIIAYSPLCRGILTDYCVEHADSFLSEIPEGHFKHSLDKFQPDNFAHNLVALKKLYAFAHDVKHTSLESLALSWILKISGHHSYKGIDKVTRILPIPSGSTIKRVELNFGNFIELTDDDLTTIDTILKENPVKGLRYNAQSEGSLFQ
ncbi:plr1 [Candida margitis]|uniref:plr1 n=1 Tax=Candida margitis TaxID=1775924 RepID=UPI0022274735|nr:plr1 [Candida margitis]KAI5969213.1 plr1 [Candida margitis]